MRPLRLTERHGGTTANWHTTGNFIRLIILSLLILGGLTKAAILGVNFLKEIFFSAILLGAVFNIIFTTIWQVEYIFKSWRKTLSEKEWMERELLQQEFDWLKQQLNPHFLFNNLNVLSSLISEDAKSTSYHLDEFSKIYRYLRRRKDALVSREKVNAFKKWLGK